MIYPPAFPDHIDEPAEEKVFCILKTLDPERYDVFYNRKFAGMRAGEQKEYQADFLIADKSGGRFNAFLVIEVKGGLVKYDGVNGRWTQNGIVIGDPVDQVRGCMDSLIKHYPGTSQKVPYGWAVCFPDERNTYSRKQVPEPINPLQLIEPFLLGTIDKHLPQLFSFIKEQKPWLHGATLKEYQLLKESLLSGLGQVVPLHTQFAAQERRLIKLTQEQIKLLDMVRENDSIAVSGPAGCGKTIMATTIARQASEEGLKVLMLTFNRIPAANIRQGLGLTGEEDNITVDNYHHFAHMEVDKQDPGWWLENIESDDFWALESAAKLDEILAKKDPYINVLIIDEGQDFREFWFESLRHILKPDGKFFIFFDEDQNIFDAFTGLPSYRQFTRFRLSHNCRNTLKIIERLEEYIEKDIPYLSGTPEGEPVQIFHYINDIEQAKIVKEEWLRLVKEEQIGPNRIVLILNTHLEQSCLRNTKSFGPYPIEPISKDTGYISPKHVNVTTIQNFKGLEADVVCILDTDKMEKEDSRILYAQASRARLWLGVMMKSNLINK